MRTPQGLSIFSPLESRGQSIPCRQEIDWGCESNRVPLRAQADQIVEAF